MVKGIIVELDLYHPMEHYERLRLGEILRQSTTASLDHEEVQLTLVICEHRKDEVVRKEHKICG